MLSTDLKDLVKEYEKENRLYHIRRKVKTEFEAMAVMKKTKGKIPMIFDQLDDYSVKTVSGMGGTRQLLAHTLGVKADELRQYLTDAILHPIPVEFVERAPCQENVVMAPFNFDEYYPVLKHYEKDNGRFIISGMMVTKSMDGTKLYTSIRRMHYLGGNKMTLLITSKLMQEQLAYYEKKKEAMEFALMFGVVPAIVLASQISTQLYDMDKLEVAGALLQQPMKVVQAKTISVPVLADAQIVLEGKVYPWKKETEGPFGEMAYYYGKVSQLPVCEFSCMTYQKDPLMYTFFPSGSEEKIPMAVAREVNLYETIRMTVPNVKEVFLTLGGQGRLHAIIQIKKEMPYDGKQAALAAFASDRDLKHVVVVDDDVDLYDLDDVEWAIATRVQAQEDCFIIPQAGGSPLEASFSLHHSSTKVGIDATAPLGNEKFARTHVPGEDFINLKDYLERWE